MTRPSEEDHKLWESIARLAEQGSSSPPEVAEESQRPSFSDRLVGRLTSGTLPLFLLSLLALVLVGPRSHTSAFLAGPFLAAAFCWLLAPLSRRGSELSAGCILLLGFPVALFTVLSQALPLLANRSYFGEEKLWDYLFVLDLQLGLETLFTPHILLSFLVLTTLFVLGIDRLVRRHPWVDQGKPPKWRVLLGWITLLAPFLLGIFFTLGSEPSPEALAWLREAQSLRSRHEASKPEHPPQEDWSEFRVQAKSHYHDRGTDLEREARNDKLPALALSALGRDLPRDPETIDSIIQITRKLLSKRAKALSTQQKAEISYLHFSLIQETGSRQGWAEDNDTLFHENILPHLCRASLSRQQLSTWIQRFETVDKSLPDGYGLLDLNAIEYFLQDHQEPENTIYAQFSGWSPEREIEENREWDMGYRKRKRTQPRSLQILGVQTPWSPSRVYIRWIESRGLEGWVAWREDIRKLPPQEFSALLWKLRYPWRKTFPLSKDFIKSLYRGFSSETVGPWLRTGILIARLRLLQLETGQYPRTLPLDDDWNPEMWSWDPDARRLEGIQVGDPEWNPYPYVWELP